MQDLLWVFTSFPLMRKNGCWLVWGGITVSKNADLVLRSPLQDLGQSFPYGRGTWHLNCPSRIQKAGKLHCPDVNATLSFETARNILKKGLIISKAISDCTKWKLWNSLFLRAFTVFRQAKWSVACVAWWFLSNLRATGKRESHDWKSAKAVRSSFSRLPRCVFASKLLKPPSYAG